MKENRNRLWFIGKARTSTQSHQHILFKDIKEFENRIRTISADSFEVEKYVERPLLIDGLKFTLRVFVVVTALNDHGPDCSSPENYSHLKAFLFDEGLAHFATQQYKAPSKDNARNEFMHNTNPTLNSTSENYDWKTS